VNLKSGQHGHGDGGEFHAVEILFRQGNFHEVRKRLRSALKSHQDTPLKRYAQKNMFRFDDDKGTWAIGLAALAFVIAVQLVAAQLGTHLH